MRALIICILIIGVPLAASSGDHADVHAALSAVGPLSGDRFNPSAVIDAVNRLVPLGKKQGLAVLRKYIHNNKRALTDSEPSALFAVIRIVFDPQKTKAKPPAHACTPKQRYFLAGQCFRPPMLGAPHPPPPEDLLSLRYPIFVLGDVPLSLVSGYSLGGLAEPLGMHLDSLAKFGQWRSKPLAPKPAGNVRYLFMHYGQWGLNEPVGKMVEAQLQRYEKASKP